MILIISAPEDIHAQAVMRELALLGETRVRILDLGEFPLRMSLGMRFGRNGTRDLSLTFPDGMRVGLDEVKAFWWRRPQGFGIPAAVSDPAMRHFAMSEAATAFQGMWQTSAALWVNDIFADTAAAHKPWQLAVAKEVGLAIPETLMTNDPEAARAFWRDRPGQVVYKQFLANFHAWRETRILRDEEEAYAEAIRLAPVIFQEYIPAVVDLRVTAVGEELLAAEAHSQTGEYKVDVRFNSQIEYRAHELPPAVSARLLALMRRLGLEYGAIDLRLTPGGEYVFLEINPAGQFLYVEMATGLPIAATLARHLARGVATPRPDRAAVPAAR
ncbi:MAG TPA: alpha-L-glutamate ligase [Candidatus Krumholzibacteria bacterium]|nr:alpha-L-glutamate ligase [Candidatus Krumholzibacteria bacterium]HPD71962.1 alpha-L-glutamate ligase [Candidatus Krumholzibacteria bacterium]HRY41105.1 alpha-L-glutamate ligase [Candidatus Krumholzibacteria bacterium]